MCCYNLCHTQSCSDLELCSTHVVWWIYRQDKLACPPALNSSLYFPLGMQLALNKKKLACSLVIILFALCALSYFPLLQVVFTHEHTLWAWLQSICIFVVSYQVAITLLSAAYVTHWKSWWDTIQLTLMVSVVDWRLSAQSQITQKMSGRLSSHQSNLQSNCKYGSLEKCGKEYGAEQHR